MHDLEKTIEEARNSLTICNSCRYCEGFCAVFPAMERRLEFTEEDIKYLANLCHNCGECYYACQYAPPHEFNVSVPQNLAKVRVLSYQEYVWPSIAGSVFRSNGALASLSLTIGIVTILLLMIWVHGTLPDLLSKNHQGNFYNIIPHTALAVFFGFLALFVMISLIIGFMKFWRSSKEDIHGLFDASAWQKTWSDVMSLRYLHGHGQVGCTYPDDNLSLWRRRYHHLTYYGFILCFCATVAGTIFHYLFGWHAPYGYGSLPKLLGITGGISLLVGTTGLFVLKLKSNPKTSDVKQSSMNMAFIVQLWLTAFSGLVLMLFRESFLLGLLLVIHLGIVMSLFLMLPYGKFVHAVYRIGALLKNALEARRPSSNVGGEG